MMTTHLVPTRCSVDQSVSELSTADSLIQEFQEFETQVYSGKLFSQFKSADSPNDHNSEFNTKTTENSLVSKNDCLQAPNDRVNCHRRDVSLTFLPSDLENDSLDDEPFNRNPVGKINKLTADVPPAASLLAENKPYTHHSLSNLKNNPHIQKPVHSSNNFPSLSTNLSSTCSDFRQPNSQSTLSLHGNLHSLNSMNIKKCCVPNLLNNSNYFDEETFRLAQNPSNSITDNRFLAIGSENSYQQGTNANSISIYALEDPIEAHDQVVAKMQADGVVWLPPSNDLCSTPLSRVQTGDLRWYSEEIEEDHANIKINTPQSSSNIPLNSRNCVVESLNQQQSKVNRNLNSKNKSVEEINTSLDPKSAQPAVVCSTNSGTSLPLHKSVAEKVDNSTMNNSLSKQSELEAQLQQAMIIRKQQDDYIRQLQTYYDNLLAKHALAEVTIDQLRMGMRIKPQSDNTDSMRSTVEQRSHSMYALDRYVPYQTPYHGISNQNNAHNGLDKLVHNYSFCASTPHLDKSQQHQQQKHLQSGDDFQSIFLSDLNKNNFDNQDSSHTQPYIQTNKNTQFNSQQLNNNISSNNCNFPGRNTSYHIQQSNYNNLQNDLSNEDKFHLNGTHSLSRRESCQSPESQFPFDSEVDNELTAKPNTSIEPRAARKSSHSSIQSISQISSISCNTANKNNHNCKSNIEKESKQHFTSIGCPLTTNNLITTLTNASTSTTTTASNTKTTMTTTSTITTIPTFTNPITSKLNNSNHSLLENVNTQLNEFVTSPEAIQMELLLRVADLHTKLSSIQTCTSDYSSISESDLAQLQTDYEKLKEFYELAKQKQINGEENKSPKNLENLFDADQVLDSELIELSLQLDELQQLIRKDANQVLELKNSDPEFSSLVSNEMHHSDFHKEPNTTDFFNSLKQTKQTTDSGVLSSPSSGPSRSEIYHFSSNSALPSPIVEDSLSELEAVYLDLLQHYNQIKQLPLTPRRADQLYNIMKRLYDLSLTANNHSSVIASPDELEHMFQLDGDTRKLSENLERAIALQKQLNANQNNSGSESNCSYNEGTISMVRCSREKSNQNNENRSCKSSNNSSHNTSQTNRKQKPSNSKYVDSSSTQDSGLSTPPDNINRVTKAKLNRSRGSNRESVDQTGSDSSSNPSNLGPASHSVTDNSVSTTHRYQTDSGVTMTVHKSNLHKCKHNLLDKNLNELSGQQSACSSGHTCDETTKKRIDALESGIHLLRDKLMELYAESQPLSSAINTSNYKNDMKCWVNHPKNIHAMNDKHHVVSNGGEDNPIMSVRSSDPVCTSMSNNHNFNHHLTNQSINQNRTSDNSSIDHNLVVSTKMHGTPIIQTDCTVNPMFTDSHLNQISSEQYRTYQRSSDQKLLLRQSNDSIPAFLINGQNRLPRNIQNSSGRLYDKSSSRIPQYLGKSEQGCSPHTTNIRSSENLKTGNYRKNTSPIKNTCNPKVPSSINQSHAQCFRQFSHKNTSSSSSSVASNCSSEDSPTIGSDCSSGLSTCLNESEFRKKGRIGTNKFTYEKDVGYKQGLSFYPKRDTPTKNVPKSILRGLQTTKSNPVYRHNSLHEHPTTSCFHSKPLRTSSNDDRYSSLTQLNSYKPTTKIDSFNLSNHPAMYTTVHSNLVNNPFCGSMPVVADPFFLSQSPLSNQSRVYAPLNTFPNHPRIPTPPPQSSLHWYPSTERLLLAHSYQNSISPRFPISCFPTAVKTCGTCGGSGQIIHLSHDNINSDYSDDNDDEVNGKNGKELNFSTGKPVTSSISPTSPIPHSSLNSRNVWRKALSSAKTKVVKTGPLRASYPNGAYFLPQNLNLLDGEYKSNFPTTDYRITSKPSFPSHLRPNSVHRDSSRRSNSKSRSFRTDTHVCDTIPTKNSIHYYKNNRPINRIHCNSSNTTNLSDGLNSIKHSNLNQSNNINQYHSSNLISSSTPSPCGITLQDVLKTASSTSLLAQQLRRSLEDLCKPLR